jgi:hypothetical protein
MGSRLQIAQILAQTSIQAFFSHLAFLHPPIGAKLNKNTQLSPSGCFYDSCHFCPVVGIAVGISHQLLFVICYSLFANNQ